MSTPTPPSLSEFTAALLAGEGQNIQQAQKNAQGKQYNFVVEVTVTETVGNKPFFGTGPITWTGVPYTAVVLMEKALLDILNQLNVVGAEIATGGEFQPKP